MTVSDILGMILTLGCAVLAIVAILILIAVILGVRLVV